MEVGKGKDHVPISLMEKKTKILHLNERGTRKRTLLSEKKDAALSSDEEKGITK